MNSALEQRLIEDLLKGRDRAFDKLYHLYWEDLFSYVVRILDNEEDAEDIVQDVFITLWNMRHEACRVRSLRAYLLVMAKNKALKHIVKSSNYQSCIDSLANYARRYEDSLEKEYIALELGHIVDSEISNLPEGMQNVFRLSRREELSYQEIAGRLDITDHTVRKQISRALKILRVKLKPWLGLF